MNEVEIRLPNETVFLPHPNFDWSEFTKEKEFDTEMFGFYKGTYISVKK
jgi:hypothetical protein